MKRNVLFIVMLLAFANVLALSKEEPIKEMGRYFTYFIITPKGEYETMNLWYQRKKDILVGEKEYLQYGGFFEDGGIIDSMVMLRQQGMKCFCYDTKRNTEYVMFDFGLQKGDIYFDDLNDAVYEVTDVRDSIIDDDNLCLIELMSQDGKHDIWLEGIGSIYTGIMRGANVFPGDVYLIRAGNNRFYPNNQYVKTADISATELIWEGKLETAEDWDAYDAWFEAPSNLNAEFADDTLHVWGRLHTSCDILPYAICGLMDNNVDFKLYSNGEVDCYKNYEIDAWIPSFERGTYKVSLYNKTLELECTANNKELVTFTEGQIATIILPIAPDASKGRYYRLDRWENKHLVFEEEPHPKARTPYIIVPNEDFNIELSTLDVNGLRYDTVRIKAVSPYDPTFMAQIRFVGTYATRSIDFYDNGYRYYTLDTTSDVFLDMKKPMLTVGAMRAYWEIMLDLCRDIDTLRYWDKLEYVLHNQDEETIVAYTEGQMATIIMPTEPDAGKGKYYRLDRVEGNEIIFEQELQPRAHVPYIIVPNEDFSIEVDALELDGLRCDTASVEGISFIGTFQKEEVESQEGFYIELIDTTPDCSLSPSGEAGREVYTIGTLRAYLLVHWDDPYSHGGTKTPAEKMEIVLHDDATGIESIQNSKFKVQNEDTAIYDVSGKPVNRKSLSRKSTRGIYIQDGKKVAFKQE